jgi:TP901 family phage tail tape measure protein
MPNNEIQFKVGISVDDKGLKATEALLNQMQQKLSQFDTAAKRKGTGIDLKDFKIMQAEVQAFERTLQMLKNNPALDFASTLERNFQRLGVAIRADRNELSELQLSLQRLNKIKEQDIAITNRMTAAQEKQATTASRVKLATSRALVEGPLYTAAYGGIGLIQQSIQDQIQLDKVITRTRIVTNDGIKDLGAYKTQMFELGKATGATGLQAAQAALIFQQQGGLAQQYANDLAKATLTISTVTGKSAEDVSSNLTAIAEAFNVLKDGPKAIEHMSDVLLKADAVSATSADQIAEAFKRSGASFKAAGFDIETATALITTSLSATQLTGENVGTAFKSLLANIQGVSAAGSKMPGSLTNKLQQVSDLFGMGMNTFSDEQRTTLKSVPEIFKEVQTTYEKLVAAGPKGETAANALANALGGKHQIAILQALLQNKEAYNNFLDQFGEQSKGATEAARKLQLQTMEAHLNTLKSTWMEMFGEKANNSGINFIIDGLNNILSQVQTLTKGSMGWLNIMTMIASTFMMIKGQKIAESLFNTFSPQTSTSTAPPEIKRVGGESLKQYDDLTARINTNTQAIRQNEAFIEENNQRVAALGTNQRALRNSIEQETVALQRQNTVLENSNIIHQEGATRIVNYANSIARIRTGTSIAIASISALGSVVNIMTDTVSTSAKVMMGFGSVLTAIGSGLLMSGAGAPVGIGLMAVGEGLNIVGNIKATADRKKAAEAAQAEMKKAQESIQKVDTGVDALNTNIQETEKNVQSLADQLTQAFNSAYESAKALLDLDINQKLYGDQSIEQAKKYFEIIKNYQEDVLSKSEKTISLSNIQNDLNNQIKNVYDPKTAKLALGFNEYLKTLKLSQNQMTAKELEYIKQQYSFIQKRLDAEKETANIQELILVRDEAGNYTYQFSQQQAGKKGATTDVAGIESQRTSAKQGINGAISGLIAILDTIKDIKDPLKTTITDRIKAGKITSAAQLTQELSAGMSLSPEVIKTIKNSAAAKYGEKEFFENQYRRTSMASALGTFNTPESRKLIDILMSSKTPITSVEGLKKASGGNISGDILTAITGSLSDANTEIKAMNDVLPDTLNGVVTTFEDFKKKMDKLFSDTDVKGIPGLFKAFTKNVTTALDGLGKKISTAGSGGYTPIVPINSGNGGGNTPTQDQIASKIAENYGLLRAEGGFGPIGSEASTWKKAIAGNAGSDYQFLYDFAKYFGHGDAASGMEMIGKYSKDYNDSEYKFDPTTRYGRNVLLAKIGEAIYRESDGDTLTVDIGQSDVDPETKFDYGTIISMDRFLSQGNPAEGLRKGFDWAYNNDLQDNAAKFDTGGYTGDWLGSGKMAVLHQKEIVLNQGDTSNILAAVQIMRDYAGQLGSVMGSRSVFNNKSSNEAKTTIINASFPNVSVADEIKKAFESMSNEAIQYGYRTKTY